jgi:diguanylate cyclase (GGDEF)-like protein/PAS domain S-box-containing protein
MIPGPDSLLVVDDEPMNRDLMARRLSKHGFNASLACSGKEALEWIGSHAVDLVLLDVQMPDMNGLEVLKEIRKTYSPARLPVIMATGISSSEDIVAALAAGANDYVTKPIDFPVVLARIQNQLSRKYAEKALRESEERYALAARAANDGLWDWDLAAGKIYFSPRWKSMLGWEEHEISDSTEEWFRRIHPDDADRVRADINAYLEEMTAHYEDEYRILHRDGNYLWMLGRAFAVRDDKGKAYRMAGSQTDITRGKVVDVLTGLPNRVLFMDRLGRAFERSQRRKDKTLALIFLDLDDFKLINDSMGHLMGDQLLVAIAGRLESTVRSGDSIARFGRNNTIARLGGDEFTILLEEIPGALDATHVAERILKELSEPFVVGGQELFPSASMGIALYNPSYQNPEELLRDADTAMYSSKALGKGRFEIFDSNMRANTIARLQLETELRKALERKEFEVHYQGIVSLETGRILGFEALVRWRHPARGLISPGEFIPVAEETGLIVPLGQWVLETAAQQMRIWQSRFPKDPPLLISVNLSARHFLQPELLEQCRAMLEKTQLSHSSLNLEVTESAMMPDPESAIEVMGQLKSLGIKIAMDDFGTGYSSLSYLHRFPLDSLKIDRSFVSRMMEDDEIVRTIITLGRNLGLTVIAEGVETADQAARLRELGCEFAQGYLFSVPVNAQQVTDLLTAQNHATQSTPATMALPEWNVYSPTSPDDSIPSLVD